MSRGDVERSETEGIGLWPKARGGREVHHWRPIRADVATPGDLFAPFGSFQKGLAARWRRNPPNQKAQSKTGGRGAAPYHLPSRPTK